MALKPNQLEFKPLQGFCPLASIPGASFPAFPATGSSSISGECRWVLWELCDPLSPWIPCHNLLGSNSGRSPSSLSYCAQASYHVFCYCTEDGILRLFLHRLGRSLSPVGHKMYPR